MKKLTLLTLTFLTLSNPAYAETVRADINGMVCDFCARALEKVFGKQDKVENIDVNLDTKVVTINFTEGQTLDDDKITKFINDAGYSVEEIRREE